MAVVTGDTVQEEAILTIGNDGIINVYKAELGAITDAASGRRTIEHCIGRSMGSYYLL